MPLFYYLPNKQIQLIGHKSILKTTKIKNQGNKEISKKIIVIKDIELTFNLGISNN